MAIDYDNFEHIICPYCFEEFGHNQVHFRAATAFEEYDLDPLSRGESLEDIELNMPEGAEKTERIKEYRRREAFLIRDDEKYTKFWSDFGTTSEVNSGISSVPDYRRPIIHPNSPEKDEDGFVYRVKDVFGNETYDRVCPHCHNPLPNNYGKYPVRFLSVIGISAAGKTVFLSKLIENIGTYAAKLDMSALPASNSSRKFVKDNKIAKNAPLPGATPTEYMSQPLFYNLTYRDGRGEKTDSMFVIYDIAGENCDDAHKVHKYGKFITNSHGLIVLIDPNQFQVLGGKSQSLTSSVLSTLKQLMTKSDFVSTPLALCVSKSDMLKQLQVLPDICYRSVNTVNHKMFCADEYNIISDRIYSFFENSETERPINVALKNNYSNFNYFAFTTLDCNAVKGDDGKYYPEREPAPKRIEEPLFWMFRQFGFIRSERQISDHSARAEKIKAVTAEINKKQRELDSCKKTEFGRKRALRNEIEELTLELQELNSKRKA